MPSIIVSRRGFLSSSVKYSAVAAVPCVPTGTGPTNTEGSGALGTVTAAVTLSTLTDNAMISYTIQNVSLHADSYTIWYVDQVTNDSCRGVTFPAQPGQTLTGVLYASLDHDIVFYVDQSDHTTLAIGPLGAAPSCELPVYLYPQPVYQPPEPEVYGSAFFADATS